MRVDWIKCSSETLDTVPKKAGQLVYVTDSKEQYFDVKNGERIKISDVIFLESIAARDSLENPFTGKLYFIIETRELWAYCNNRWVDVELGTQAWKTIFDNTNVPSSAVNAQQALEELYNNKLNKVAASDVIYCNDSNGNPQTIDKTTYVVSTEYNTFKDTITETVSNNMTTLQGEISNLQDYVDDEVAAVSERISTITEGVDEKIAQGDSEVKQELTDLIDTTKTDIETDYNTKIGTINTTITNIQQDITDLDNNKIDKNITAILSTGSTLTNEVEGITFTDNRINPSTNETSTVTTLLKSSDIEFETDANGINLSIPELDTLDTKIDDNYTSLDSKITLLKTDYEANKALVDDEIGRIDTSITTLQESVSTNASDIDTLEGKVTAVETDVTTIQNDISDIQNDISDIQQDLSNVEAMHNFSEYPSIQSQNVSTTEMFNSIKALNLNTGTMLLGGCKLTDFPTGLINGEVQVMIYPNNVLYAVLRSSNLYPYEWIANSHTYNGWISLSDNVLIEAKEYTDTKTENITNIETRLTTAEGNISTNAADITNLTTRLDTAETNISTNATDITNIETRLDTAETNIDNLETQVETNVTNISTLRTDVDNNTTSISDLSTDNQTNKTNITNLQTKITEAETDIDNLETQVGTNTANISSLTSRVTDTENDITTINSTIEDIQEDISSFNTDISSLDERITTNTTNISTNTSNITTNTTNITTNANAISVLQTRTEANRITGETNTLAIEGLRNEIDTYHHYFQGYFEHTYLIEELVGERGDYAYNGETGTIWSFDTVWSDTLDPIPSDLAGKSQTTPLMDGTATVGTENYYAAGDHVHPTDITRAAASDLQAHIDNTTNPHNVTKAQVGLGNVDNTADIDKPVSTAVQALITNLQSQITALQAEVEALKGTVQTEVQDAEDIADEILGE